MGIYWDYQNFFTLAPAFLAIDQKKNALKNGKQMSNTANWLWKSTYAVETFANKLNTKSVSIWLIATMYTFYGVFIVGIGREKSSLAQCKRVYIIQHICKHDISINFFFVGFNSLLRLSLFHFATSFFLSSFHFWNSFSIDMESTW